MDGWMDGWMLTVSRLSGRHLRGHKVYRDIHEDGHWRTKPLPWHCIRGRRGRMHRSRCIIYGYTLDQA